MTAAMLRPPARLPDVRIRRAWTASIVMLACLVALPGCSAARSSQHQPSGPSSSASPSGPSPSGPQLTGSLLVSADSSLSPVMSQLVSAFVAAHPSVRLFPVTYEGPNALAAAIAQGATPDVVAMADPAAMAQLTSGGLVVSATVQTFARDPLEIAVKAGNPEQISSLADLAKPGINVALPDPSVPLGLRAAQALALAGVRVNPVSTQLQAQPIIQSVVTGTVDAGIVAASDVSAAGAQVAGVPIPPAGNVDAMDLAAPMVNSPNQEVAAAFVAYLSAPAAAGILRAAGFLPGAGG